MAKTWLLGISTILVLLFTISPDEIQAGVARKAVIAGDQDASLKLGQNALSESVDGDIARNRDLYGFATISPKEEISAGAWGTWTITYHVGRLGIDDGGRIFILTQAACDWGPFQMDDPKGANYTTVHTTGHAKVKARFERRHASPRPWWRGIEVTVSNGSLQQGDEVIVTLGDRSEGGPGSRAQTFDQQEAFEFRVLVDVFNTVRMVRVLDSPRVRIVGGKTVRLEALWPTEVVVGEPTWLLVRTKDYWGNPSPSYRGALNFHSSPFVANLPDSYTFTAADGGFHRFEGIKVTKPGVHCIQLRANSRTELNAETNPLIALPHSELLPYWGDLHGQSGETGGLGPIDSYFAYASGFAGIDYASWAGNDVHITPQNWKAVQGATKRYNRPGRFVSFLGYEWSGNTVNGGDHNVIYLEDDQPIYRSAYVEEEGGHDWKTERHTIAALTPVLPLGQVLLMPHVGGRRANLDFFQPEFMPFVEVYSNHGQFEWFLEEALERGLKVGFVANSDDVYGKPGESIPGIGLFAVHGGLTCVYAHSLDREQLWEGFFNRRVYGTTGERIRLRFQSAGHWMGEEIFTGGPATFTVEATGTAGIERVDLHRGSKRIYRFSPAPDGDADRIKVIWRGAFGKHRARQVSWEGYLELSEGSIQKVLPYRFDYPTEVYECMGRRRVNFRSLTSGDEDGLIFEIEAPRKAVLHFEAYMMSRNQFGQGETGKNRVEFSVPLHDLSAEDWIYSAGKLDRQVVLRRVGQCYPNEICFEWTEKEIPGGTSAYWVRLLQQDGAVAWSSPIYVTR